MSILGEQFFLDSRLLSPKLHDISRDINARAAAGERQISFEVSKSGNAAGYFPRLFDFYIELAEERANRIFDAYCETWKEQNRSVTPAFIRWVRGKAIIPGIDTRKSTVLAEIQRRAVSTNQPLSEIVERSWNLRMGELATKLGNKMEAEAVKLEYRSVQHRNEDRGALPSSSSGTTPRIAKQVMPDADAWRAFRAAFETLRQEESSGDIPHGQERWVLAYSQRDMTKWYVSGGDEGLRARLEVLAARAGARLGPVQESTKLDYWLHRLYLDLKRRHSKLLFEADGGTPQVCITRVSEASAIFCAQLEQEAVENSSETGTIGGSQALGIAYTGANGSISRPQNKGRPSKRSADFCARAGELWAEALKDGRKVSDAQLAQIASALDDSKFVPPANYLEESFAREVRDYNTRHSNSKRGPIKTWGKLLECGDKNHVRGMRKLLSRCAKRPFPLSGK